MSANMHKSFNGRNVKVDGVGEKHLAHQKDQSNVLLCSFYHGFVAGMFRILCFMAFMEFNVAMTCKTRQRNHRLPKEGSKSIYFEGERRNRNGFLRFELSRQIPSCSICSAV
jgi:hypothetical protein